LFRKLNPSLELHTSARKAPVIEAGEISATALEPYLNMALFCTKVTNIGRLLAKNYPVVMQLVGNLTI